jgi:hypothetical protein
MECAKHQPGPVISGAGRLEAEEHPVPAEMVMGGAGGGSIRTGTIETVVIPPGTSILSSERCGDSDRQNVLAALRDAYARGYLSEDELLARIDVVLAAQSCSQLLVLLRDLPMAALRFDMVNDLPAPGGFRAQDERHIAMARNPGHATAKAYRAGSRMVRFATVVMFACIFLLMLSFTWAPLVGSYTGPVSAVFAITGILSCLGHLTECRKRPR